MSSSVIVARTRIWRMMVAAARGGSFCGAIWQRLQLARNRFSPSILTDGSTRIADVLVLEVELDFGAVDAERALPVAALGVATVDVEVIAVCC